MAKKEYLPDHLRCNRTDGRTWRCNRPVWEDKKLCEIHYIQGQHRAKKQKVPESLKIERKLKSKNTQNQEIRAKRNQEIRATQNQETGAKQSQEIWAKQKEKEVVTLKEKETLKRKQSVGEALDETLKKIKLKRGDLQLELIREFLKRQVEKKKEKELVEIEKEMKELPNGVISITPSPSPQEFNNAGPYNVKVGLSCSSIQQRHFRSKNIEPVPISTMQILPCVRDAAKLKKVKRGKCHWCRRSSYVMLIKCGSCRKQFFCVDCIEERCFDKEEVKTSCPICRGTCSCKACSTSQSKDIKNKDSCKGAKKIDKIHPLHYLIHILLPVLEKINREQSIELGIEAEIKGVTLYEIQIPQVKLGCKKLNCCSNCKTSIVDFHRSCTSCSYNFCLSCCREFRQGKLGGGIKEINKVMYPNRKRACTSDAKLKSRQGSGSKSTDSPTLSQNWKVCEDGKISCPPKIFGGCGDSTLDLRCVFSFGWIIELQQRVQEIVARYDFTETSGYKANRLLQETAMRDNSSDNDLYYPTVQELRIENLGHFRKHWGKGHPVLVRNVIRSTPNLSWDPVVMFCNYLGNSNAKSQNDKRARNTTNCLDWCEVEIGNKQIFMGSLEDRTHAYMCRETVKLKAWLSSHLFQEHFPAHYTEIMQALPLKEYMDPRCGLLNLAVKLPEEMHKPDLGPCVYIAYGESEEFMQANFLTRLCYDSCDVVNILAHATDIPISTKEIGTLKTLLKKYKTQDHRKSTDANDQPLENQVEIKSSLQSGDAEEMAGKSSFRSEVTEESVSRDVIGQDLNLPDGIGKVSMYSGDAQSVEDQNKSSTNEQDPEFDSEPTILCSGTIQKFEDSEDENSCDDDVEGLSCNEEKSGADSCGAQWDIFRRQDVPKLLEYLRRHSNELSQAYCNPKHVIHPILDQSFFLDPYHKMRLKEEFNIEPWTFKQNIGEAVIIPAGCPYQVRHLKSCVNLILEFISPENAPECIRLADEHRLLPLHHKAKEKIPEVEKMTLYRISAAIEEMSNLARVEQSKTQVSVAIAEC